MIGDQKRSCEDGFGTVPLLFDFEEILTASLADLGSLYHAQLFCHIHTIPYYRRIFNLLDLFFQLSITPAAAVF